MFGLVLHSTSASMVDLVTLKLQANPHPSLVTSPHPVSPPISSGNSSTSQKSCTITSVSRYMDNILSVSGNFQANAQKENNYSIQGYPSPFTKIIAMVQGMLQLINILTRLCETTLHAMKNGQGCCFISTVTAHMCWKHTGRQHMIKDSHCLARKFR